MEENKYRYNNKADRYIRMNRFYLLASWDLWLMFLAYMWLKRFSGGITPWVVYATTIFIISCSTVNLIAYLKNKAGGMIKRLMTIEGALLFLLLGLQTDAEFIYFILIILLALQIPYYDGKNFKAALLGYYIITLIVVIARMVGSLTAMDVDGLCRAVGTLLALFVIGRVEGIAKEFSDHSLGYVGEQQQKQQQMFDGVLGVSKTVHQESVKSSSLVEELVKVTQSVAANMQEITTASNTTAESIEEQSGMTQNIQDAIGTAGEYTGHMVEIAEDSNNGIRENMRIMEELKTQSVQISDTNHHVTESMGRLQEKTKEVENIAGMILKISNQTNLLALNASIESARAGEAGRGFAVVAEQIRQLAEQTRNSTEEISKIISELNQNADEVVRSVEGSVQAVDNQNEKILAAAETVEKLDQNMGQLVSGIEEVNRQVEGLSDSNNRIVENIGHLSAATQQVTASAEQINEMSQQNLEFAEQVKGAVDKIMLTADELEQYL